jgi:hypothetical protein
VPALSGQRPMATITNITGVVESVNASGFKIKDGNWLNYSDYGYKGPTKGGPAFPAPNPGDTVTVELRNNKFVHTMAIGGNAPITPSTTPNPTPPSTPDAVMHLAPPGGTSYVTSNSMDKLLDTTIQVRLKLLGTIAVAKPDNFDLDNLDTLTEIVRNLEQFVLEDLIAATKPETDEDLTADDLTDEI